MKLNNRFQIFILVIVDSVLLMLWAVLCWLIDSIPGYLDLNRFTVDLFVTAKTLFSSGFLFIIGIQILKDIKTAMEKLTG